MEFDARHPDIRNDLATFEPASKARPGDMITWSVDRVRAVPWLGAEFISTLEYNAFKTRDYLKRTLPSLFAADAQGEVTNNLGTAPIRPKFTDPETGWPPAPLKPLLTPALKNEGEWDSLDDDPFVGKNAGLPSPFVRSFVRPDPKRNDILVYITLWDPRQVSMHMVAGVIEPESATGEHCTGQIPRTVETLKNVVAGFNGGFQAIHFEGGMQVSGTMYLPPKPYAATAAEMIDGATAFGVWPAKMPNVPDTILSMRQNLTPLVLNGVYNPYKQQRWGGTPVGAKDNIHSARSGICLTKDQFVAYFFGFDLSPENLGAAMIAANCDIGMHLDMNAGHTGFEFYRVAPTGSFPDLGAPLEPGWQAEKEVPGLTGWSFRARRMIKNMPHMLFPRYIAKDNRDFMYLTLRAILPGDNLVPLAKPPIADEGVWVVKGLPQHGFPYALAETFFRPDSRRPEVSVRLVKIDPRTVTVGHDRTEQTVLTLGRLPDLKANRPSLWFADGAFVIANEAPSKQASLLFEGDPPADFAAATRMIGVLEEEGSLVIAEGPANSGPTIKALLQQMKCVQTMVVPSTMQMRLGTKLNLAAEVAQDSLSGPFVTLERAHQPFAVRLFPDTPLVDPNVWQPLQNKRVRYMPKPASSKSTAASGSAPTPRDPVPEPPPKPPAPVDTNY
jgi:hypothetical protein